MPRLASHPPFVPTAGALLLAAPARMILAARCFIGMGNGVSYAGVTPTELRKFVPAGIACVIILVLLAIAFAELVVLTGLAAQVEGFLAFAPADRRK